jgi:hypothetical protein
MMPMILMNSAGVGKCSGMLRAPSAAFSCCILCSLLNPGNKWPGPEAGQQMARSSSLAGREKARLIARAGHEKTRACSTSGHEKTRE